MAVSEKNRKRAAWVAIATTCVAGFEGIRQVAYRDPVGIPTICFGETKGVRMGQKASMDECKAMLADSLEDANNGVNRCIHKPINDNQRAALVSFTYNVGTGSLCKSGVARRFNAGDATGGCNELTKWVYAKGIKLPGLVRRRDEERKICLAG